MQRAAVGTYTGWSCCCEVAMQRWLGRAAILVLTAILSAGLAFGEETWIQLFNGRDLTGWTPKIVGHAAGDNFADTFRVENGLLEVAATTNTTATSKADLGICSTSDRFRIIEFESNTGSSARRRRAPAWAYRNNGIMIHGQAAESMGLGQSFPVSMEFQLLGGDGKKDRPNGSLWMPGTRAMKDGKLLTAHCTNSTSKTFTETSG